MIFWECCYQGKSCDYPQFTCFPFCHTVLSKCKLYLKEDFPGGAVVKNPPASAGDAGSSPGRGRSHLPQSS